MTHTPDDTRPSPLDFPEGLGPDEKAARWRALLAEDASVPEAELDAALYELMSRSRRGG